MTVALLVLTRDCAPQKRLLMSSVSRAVRSHRRPQRRGGTYSIRGGNPPPLCSQTSKRSDEPMNVSARVRPFATIAMMATVFTLAAIEPSYAQSGGIENV